MRTSVTFADIAEWTEGDGDLQEVTVSLEEGQTPSKCIVRVADPFMRTTQRMPLPVRDSKIPVEVFRGQKVFAGYYSSIGNSGPPGMMKLEFVDKARGIRRVPRSSVLTDASAAQQIRLIAERAGFGVTFQGDSERVLNDVRYGQRVQNGVSDVEFLMEMLDSLGHSMHFRNDTLVVRAVGAYAGAAKTLTFGTDGQIARWDFSIPEMTRRTTPNVYSQAGSASFVLDPLLDPEVQQRAVALERTGVLFDVSDLPAFTDQTVEQALQAQARARKLFRAQIELTDLHLDLDVDSAVLIRGAGFLFSGIWNIESVKHSMVPKGVTSLSLYNGGAEDAEGEILFVSDVVYFDFDRSVIRADQEVVLDRVAARLQASPDSRLVLQGHADERGTDAYNVALSLRRSQAVLDALTTRGISPRRLSVEAFGESSPVSENHALNRRVEFKVN